MSKLQELIQRFCPDGVEYKKIHDVAEVGTGCCNGNEADVGGVYPFFVRSQNVKAKNDFQYDEEAIIIPGEGGIGDIFHYVNGKYALHQRVYRIHFIDKTINAKFIYYYMKSNFKSFILKKAVSATVTSIRKPMIEKFEIPIPPLDVQNEIVRILDTFTSHAAELQAELQARKEQYEYYRNKLLTFDKDDKNVKWMNLGEVYDIKAGKSIPASEISSKRTGEKRFPCYGGNGLRGYVSLFNQEGEKVLIGRQGALCGNVNFAEDQFYATEHAIVVSDRGYCLPRYTFYLLIIMNLNQYKTAGAQPGLSVSRLEKILLPIPSISEQQRIVSVIDKFETLVNDLTEGLPAEIAAVQEQYEYYRNKLLTFKQK